MWPRTNYRVEEPEAYFRGVRDRNCQQQFASNPYFGHWNEDNIVAKMNAWEDGWNHEDATWVAAGRRTLHRPALIAATI